MVALDDTESSCTAAEGRTGPDVGNATGAGSDVVDTCRVPKAAGLVTPFMTRAITAPGEVIPSSGCIASFEPPSLTTAVEAQWSIPSIGSTNV
jgi:hypothetical protein